MFAAIILMAAGLSWLTYHTIVKIPQKIDRATIDDAAFSTVHRIEGLEEMLKEHDREQRKLEMRVSTTEAQSRDALDKARDACRASDAWC